MTLIPLCFNSFFYFTDDYQNQHLGMWLEISRILSNGEFPLLTSRSWYGGSILYEYQYAIFSPVSLVLYLILYKIQLPLEQSAAAFSILHLMILSLGCFLLARKLKISLGGSYFAGLSILHSGFLVYWAAATWVPILVAFTWLPWAVLGFYRIQERKYAALAMAASYLLIASGAAYQIFITLGIYVLGISFYFYLQKEYRNMIYAVVAFSISFLLAMPTTLPILTYLPFTTRGLRDPYGWKLSLEHLLAVGMPTFRGVYKIWGGYYGHSQAPFVYVSWLAPIVILGYLTCFKRRTTNLIKSKGALVVLLGLSGMFPLPFLSSFAFKFLPGLHLSILLFALLILSHENEWEKLFRWRTIHFYSALLFVLPVLNHIGSREVGVFVHIHFIVSSSIIVILYLLKLVYFPEEDKWSQKLLKRLPRYLVTHLHSLTSKKNLLWGSAITLSTIIFVGILFISKRNNNVPDLRINTKVVKANPLHLNENDRVFYFLEEQDYWPNLHKPRSREKIMLGNAVLYQKHTTLNGYSSVPYKKLVELCPFDYISAVGERKEACIKKLFEKVMPYNKPLIELMGLNKILTASRLKHLLEEHKPVNWHLTSEADQLALYVNSKSSQADPIFGFLPEGVVIKNLLVNETSIQFSYKTNEKYDGSPIAIARLGIPGYFYKHNEEEAKAPLLVSGLIPQVPLKKDGENRIELYYFPNSLRYGLYISIFGLMLSFIFIYSIRREKI